MINKFIKFQIKHHKLIVLLFIVLASFSLYLANDIKIDASLSSLLDKEDVYSSNYRAVKTANGFTDTIFILVKEDDNEKFKLIESLNDEKVHDYLNNLKDVLLKNEYIVSIQDPEFSSDYSHAKLELYIDVPQEIGGSTLVFNELESIIQDNQMSGLDVAYSGSLVLTDKIISYLIKDNITAIIITLSLIFLILFLFSRDFYFTLVVISTPVLALLFITAFMVITNIAITVTLAALGVLVLGLGVDYSVHLAIHYKQASSKYPHEEALLRVIDELKMPLTASFLTTFAGFMALMFAVGEATQNQGILLSMIIAIIFFLSFTSFPSFLTLFHKKIKIKENKIFSIMIKKITNLAKYQTKHPAAVLGVIGITTVLLIIGATNIEFSTDQDNWIPSEDISKITIQEKNLAFPDSSDKTESFVYLIKSTQGDLRNIQIKTDIEQLEKELTAKTNVINIKSAYENLPNNQIDLKKTLSNPLYKNYFNDDYTLSSVIIEIGDPQGFEETTFEVVDKLINSHEIINAELTPFDEERRQQEIGKNLGKDIVITTIISFILVFLIVTIIYWSIGVGAMSMTPIFLAIIWTIGIMGITHVPFTQLSIGIVSLVLGIGIDFSIHLVDNIRRNLEKMDLDKAIVETLNSSGSSILLSSITTFFGFLALLTAKLTGTRYFGITLAFAIISVLAVSITTIPAIFSLFYNKRNRVKNNV